MRRAVGWIRVQERLFQTPAGSDSSGYACFAPYYFAGDALLMATFAGVGLGIQDVDDVATAAFLQAL